MNQSRIILESSPLYIIVCAALAIGIAFLLYRRNHPWSVTWNWILFGTRSLLVFLLMFLLLGPIVRQINNFLEKPLFVILHDTSASIKEASDSVELRRMQEQLKTTQELLEEKGYEVKINSLIGEDITTVVYNHSSTDLTNALRKIANRYEGHKVAGVVLPSDGIYNAGVSPLFASYSFPIYTIGIGDTIQRPDVGIKNVAYNKIAYQGNKYPLRVEVIAKNISGESINVALKQGGKIIEQQTKRVNQGQLLVYDFQPLAHTQGIQKLDIEVEVKPQEYNTRNNRTSIFVEVIEGKKKILVVAPSPHPDIKALREVIEKNSNYEFLLRIPGMNEQSSIGFRANEIDLVIFHQSPDTRGRTRELFQQFLQSKASLFIILGQQSDVRFLTAQNIPVKYDSPPRDYDQVTPVTNPAFTSFSISSETISILTDFPPVSVHFGKIKLPLTASALLYQRVGSISTDKPLLAIDVQDSRKIGVMFGEGLWRWKLNEYDRTESTQAFDELFGKLIQYLSTTDDRRKFRSYPIQQEFSDIEPVVFESQVYNDIFEPVYGNTIDIEITNEAGQKTNYSYVTSPGNTRYQIGGLNEGVYRYRSRTTINQKQEEVRGEFAVIARQSELQNLTADFDLLRKISAQTGGKFFKASDVQSLNTELQKVEARSIIHSEESYDYLLNLKIVFWILLLLVSIEWFVRKFFGSY